MSRLVPAVTAALLALGVAACAAAGTGPLLAAATLLVLGVSIGWSSLLALPSPRGSATVVGAAGLAAVVVVAATPGEPALRDLPVVLGLGVLGAFAHQLLRRDLRPRVVDGVSGVLAGMVVVASSSGWLAALAPDGGPGVVRVGAAAVALASVASSLAGPRSWRWAVAPVVGAAAAAVAAVTGTAAVAAVTGTAAVAAVSGTAAVAAVTGTAAVGTSALLGLVVGLVAAVVHDVLAPLAAASRTWPSIALGSAPVAAAGLVVYVGARVMSG